MDFADLFAGVGGFHLALHCAMSRVLTKSMSINTDTSIAWGGELLAKSSHAKNVKITPSKLRAHCIFASEIDINAKATYALNFPHTPLFGDITQESTQKAIPSNFDILCAGFPCQAFSVAGHQKGFNDTRGTLFFEIEKIARIHKPKVLFLENVKNLKNHDKGRTFATIKTALENLGFDSVIVEKEREGIYRIDIMPLRSYEDFIQS